MLCFRNLQVAKKFRWGGGVSRISVEVLSHSAENFRRESFTVALISGTQKVWRRGRGGGVSRFSVEIFLSHSAENFRRGTLQCFTIFGCRRFLYFRGSYHGFRFSVEFFWSQCRNYSQVNPSVLCFRNLPVAKMFR